MFSKAWLDSIEGLKIDYYEEDSLECMLGERAICIRTSEFSDETISTDMWLMEDGITLAEYWKEETTDEQNKDIFIKWMIEKMPVMQLSHYDDGITIDGIYEHYLKGEADMIAYKWAVVRERLKEFPPHFYPEQKIELLDRCFQSAVLKNYNPYISVGRLCLSNTNIREHYDLGWPCFNFIDGKYEVANYEHENIHLFDTTDEVVAFVEQEIARDPGSSPG